MNIDLSTRQQRIIGSALTASAVVLLLFVVLGAFRVITTFVSTFSGVFLPLATAGVLSLLLRPVFNHMRLKWKWPAVASLAAIFGSVFIPLLILLWVFGVKLINQAAELIRSAPELAARLHVWIQGNAPNLAELIQDNEIGAKLQGLAQNQADALLSLAAGGAEGLVSVAGYLMGLFNWAVLPVYIIFLMMAPPFKRSELSEILPFLKENTRDDVVYLINQFVDIVVTFFRGQLIIALAQGVLMAIGFSVVGLQYGFLLGLVIGLLNIIPYLGNLVGLAVTLPLAYLQPEGGVGLLIAVLVVIGIVQVVEGYVLTPRIMGESTGLHPMVIIVAMFFWGTAFNGILGMILAIPLTAFLVVFWRLAKEKYIEELL